MDRKHKQNAPKQMKRGKSDGNWLNIVVIIYCLNHVIFYEYSLLLLLLLIFWSVIKHINTITTTILNRDLHVLEEMTCFYVISDTIVPLTSHEICYVILRSGSDNNCFTKSPCLSLSPELDTMLLMFMIYWAFTSNEEIFISMKYVKISQ